MAYGPAPSYWLASTADRERAVDVLRAGFTEGRLTQAELDERVARAYASRTYGELGELTADLPVGPLGALRSPGPGPTPMMGVRTAPVAARAGTGSRPVTSTAGLVLTALVVFTLAALITSVAVYLHSHGYGYGFTGQPGQIHLMPQVTRLGPPTSLRNP